MPTQNYIASIEYHFEKYLTFLCNICSFEGRAKDKEAINCMMDYIADFAHAEGFQTIRTPMENCADFLCVEMNAGAEKGCSFMAHTDTVHDKGVFGENPVTRLSDRIIAPGVIDCKGGIAIALLAMKALQENGYNKHLRLLLTSDEEVSNVLGGQAEVDYFANMCAGFPYAINCETSEGDEVVISRKGILKYRIDIKGSGGHSGIHYFDCKNAIEEAAHKILALHSRSRQGGITYSCNIIEGGKVPNIIPDTCTVTVDIRVPRHSDMDEAMNTVQEIAEKSFLGGTTATVTRISKRPPMEKNPETMALFDKLLSVCQKHGLGSLTPVESGGGSDSCYTQAAGIPSICGMGACGEFCHTNKEYALIDSVSLRAKLIALFLLED
ncbi:MAG: M20/M25/M40 family metallo-hydrolase [Oscillospiraceae bacterium]|nr:M20/M25/M40 family metallo-hydrolase [Oscillospiraceae bacterium]